MESTIKSQCRISQYRKLKSFCHDYVVTRACTCAHTQTQNKCHRTNLILYIFHATTLHIQYYRLITKTLCNKLIMNTVYAIRQSGYN